MSRLAPIGLTILAHFTGIAPLASQNTPLQPVLPEDYGKWETLSDGRLSPDGTWIAVSISRVNEENELRIHRVEGDSVIVVPHGANPIFSGNGEWVAYTIGESPQDRETREQKEEPLRNDVGLVNLETGQQTRMKEVQSFLFGARGDYLSMRRYPTEDGGSTASVVVRDLLKNTDVSFGSVASSVWQDEGDLLAFIVHADEDVGNGVQLYDARSGTVRMLDGDTTKYARLTWREDAADLAVLRSFTDDVHADTNHVVLAWRDLENGGRPSTLESVLSSDISNDQRIVSYRALTWSEDSSALFFGVKEWGLAEEEKDGNSENATDTESADAEGQEADVEIWNTADRRVIPEQKRDATRDEQRNELAVWHLDEGRVVILTDESLNQAEIHAGGRAVTAVNDDPYGFDAMFGRGSEDVYRIDAKTGDRLKVVEGTSFRWQVSPEGDFLVHFKDGAYHVVNLATGATRIISGDVDADLNNADYDHPVAEKPPFGLAGWTVDNRSVLVYDKYDVWQLGLDGLTQKLTDGAPIQVVYRHVSMDPDEDAIDLTENVYLSARGEWTLYHGYALLREDRVEELVYEDDNLDRLIKADAAEVFAFVGQDFDDPPDYFVTDLSFRSPRQITAVNPFHTDYAWGHSELIQYTNHRGRKLQGALFYPANYDPSTSYPMITYVYEIRSQSAKQYAVPSERSYYNWAAWTAQGYFVWQPDIVFDTRNPGISSTRTMEASIQAVVDKNVGVDPDRVGLVGHSWGGYQAAFAATNTKVFAAIVAGAALTDLVSMYGSIFWSSSVPETGHFEVGQERMEVPYWEDLTAYVRNSAVHNIETLDTPILVEVADADRNVDWRQGIEYFNAARRAGKALVMLAYHDEGHGLRKERNQVDYHRRILRWFGHYLKGEEAPDWIVEPVPYLEQRKGG